MADKRRKLELTAGATSRRGNHRRPGAAYNDKTRRRAEAEAVEAAEHAYEVLVSHCRPQRRRTATGLTISSVEQITRRISTS